MAITVDSRSKVASNIRAFFKNRMPGWGYGARDFLGPIYVALSWVVYGILKELKAADNDGVPTSATSDAGLDNWGSALGVPSNAGPNKYGRNVAEAATGGVGTSTGSAGATIADGLALVYADGITLAEIANGPYTVGMDGTVQVDIVATTAGAAGNLDVGETISFVTAPVNIDGTITLTSALVGGLDVEDKNPYLTRIQTRAQKPPKGGAANDYKTWSEAAADGVTAYIYPKRSGTGTVDVVLFQVGSGAARAAVSDQLAAVATALDLARPVTVEGGSATNNTFAPVATDAEVVLRVVPNTGFFFDWNDTAAGYPTVKAGGTTTLLRVNGTMPAAFTAAWGMAAVGKKPRIQIAATSAGSPAACAQARVTAIDTTTVSPDTILTLDVPLAVYPTASDKIYSGGDVVAQVQADVLAYSNLLGPSKASGYADAGETWDCDLEVARLIQIAIDSKSISGVRLCSNLVAVGGIPQALINGTVADMAATDTLGIAPEFIYLRTIIVAQ